MNWQNEKILVEMPCAKAPPSASMAGDLTMTRVMIMPPPPNRATEDCGIKEGGREFPFLYMQIPTSTFELHQGKASISTAIKLPLISPVSTGTPGVDVAGLVSGLIAALFSLVMFAVVALYCFRYRAKERNRSRYELGTKGRWCFVCEREITGKERNSPSGLHPD